MAILGSRYSGRARVLEAAEKAHPKAGVLGLGLLTRRQTPLVWSFKMKDLEGSSVQVFEE
jgi:hypothetical protein